MYEKTKISTIIIRLSDADKELLREIQMENATTISSIVRTALKKHLNKYRKCLHI